jgi:hypothetical protein
MLLVFSPATEPLRISKLFSEIYDEVRSPADCFSLNGILYLFGDYY